MFRNPIRPFRSSPFGGVRRPLCFCMFVCIFVSSPIGRAASFQDARDQGKSAIPQALRENNFPWYDAPNDRFEPDTKLPYVPKPQPRSTSADSALRLTPKLWDFTVREWIVRLVQFFGLLILIGILFWGVRRFAFSRKFSIPLSPPAPLADVSFHLEDLGVQNIPDHADLSPGLRARALRQAGRHREAVILMFVNLLVILCETGRLRPRPGATLRQMLRTLEEPDLRTQCRDLLRVFESAYYGLKDPDPAAYDAFWNTAIAVETALRDKVRVSS